VAVVGWADRRDAFHTIWRGRAAGWPTAVLLFWLAVALVLAAGVTVGLNLGDVLPRAVSVTVAGLLGAGGLVLAGEAVASCLVLVRISAYSVQVRPGLLPFAGTTVPVRSIRSAEVVVARHRPWEGWGWWWMPRPARAVVVRSGPALRIDLTSGRFLVIGVDHPRYAMAALRHVTADW
jgi:hypothetical protein